MINQYFTTGTLLVANKFHRIQSQTWIKKIIVYYIILYYQLTLKHRQILYMNYYTNIRLFPETTPSLLIFGHCWISMPTHPDFWE